MLGTRTHVVDVDDAPRAAQPPPVLAAVARAATQSTSMAVRTQPARKKRAIRGKLEGHRRVIPPAAVVDIEDSEASRSEELDNRVEAGGGGTGGAAMRLEGMAHAIEARAIIFGEEWDVIRRSSGAIIFGRGVGRHQEVIGDHLDEEGRRHGRPWKATEGGARGGITLTRRGGADSSELKASLRGS